MDDIAPTQEWRDFRVTMETLSEQAHDTAARHTALWLQAWLNERRGNQGLFTEIDASDFIRSTKATYFFARSHLALEIANKMEAQTPKSVARDCLAYHIVIGSTPDFSIHAILDFPGEFSLKEMLERGIADKEPALSPQALLTFNLPIMRNMLSRSSLFEELYPGYIPPPHRPDPHRTALQPDVIQRILGLIPSPGQ